ncbi:polymorphic toxin-type HINT domain-containing protein [Micromonospora sp. NPDC049523]|uniref:polymorphic toxin-type HINT domain-containing protein n=1 Tax=Micromonospora sp. NPDC049523 TaxID=3155921 RepID=UPI00341E60EB
MFSRTLLWIPRARWLALLCILTLVVTLAPPAKVARAQVAPVPTASPGPGPVDRPLPDSVRPDKEFPPDKRPPVVPPGTAAQGEPNRLSAAEWARVPKPGVARTAAEDEVFDNLLLRSGFALGETSVVAYFDVAGEEQPWTSWKATIYDAESRTEQASTTLGKDELERARCTGQRQYCRSFGTREGWVLDPTKDYYVTATAIFDDGREIISEPSDNAKPRTTIEPPAIPAGQAAGCGCGNALGLTAAGQAVRGIGVNTATGAFVRVEQDLGMASFGVPFASSRTYSSASPAGGPFGPGWAWSYGMTVTESADGVVVRAEDGAEAIYRLDGESYRRPPGVRSNLRRIADGWELVTLSQITHRFDAQGRLVSVANARGMGTRLAYTATGVTVTDASGREVKVKVDAGLIREIRLPDGRQTQYYYTGTVLTAVKDARGYHWKYTYGANGLLTEVMNPQRIVELRNEYGADNRVVRQSDALGKATTFEWKAAEQEALTVDPDAVKVYDGYRGNVLIYTQRGNGDTENHRYDGSLNRPLVVNGKHSQHEATFDDAGNRISQTAPRSLNFGTKTKYDARNNPTEHTDANGNVWQDTYNEFDELVESVDAEKNKITYAYDERGLLVSQTDQRGKVTRYENLPVGDHNSGLLKAVISPEGRRSEVGYDRTGRATSTVDPRGTVRHADRDDYTTRYEFDAQDRPTVVHQPGKRGVVRTSYDEVGRTRTQTTQLDARTEYRYFDNGLLRSVSDSRRTTSYTYTDAGRRASARVEMKHEPDLVTTYAYNAKGLLNKVTSPRGNVPGANPADFTTTYYYDANDNPLRVERPYPGGRTVSRDIGVDELDRTRTRTDEHNKTSQFDRDNTGNVTAVSDNLGRTSRMEYDRNGRQTSIRDAGTNTSRFEYDEAGNKIKQIAATGGISTWEYDGDGLLVAATEPRGNVEGADKERFTSHHEYDLAGNRVKSIDPLDHVTSYRYDANNRLLSVTDAKDRTTHYTYREDDLPRTVHTPDSPYDPREPADRSTVYDYYEDGLPSSVRDPNGHRTSVKYDEAGRAISSTDPLGRVTEVSYDAEGNPVSTITLDERERLSPQERARRTAVDTYDIVGRREARALGSEGPRYTWGYDAKDRTTTFGDPTGVRTVVYDDEDQIDKVTRNEPATNLVEEFDYDYDVRGNITLRAYPDGTRITADYDGDSRITSLTASGGSAGAVASTWRFGYDVAGRRTSTTLPTPTGLIEQRGYDDAGRLTSIGTTRAPAPEQFTLPTADSPNTVAGDDRPKPPTDVTAQPGAGLAVVSWKPSKDHGHDDVAGYTVTAQPGGKSVTVGPTASSAIVNGLDAGVAYTFTVTAHDRYGAGAPSVASDPVVPVALPQDPISAYQLDLDELGNPTKVVTTRGGVSETVAYAYDKVDRLTSACYAVDSCGGRTKPVGRIDYEYDLVGNRTSQKRTGNAGDDTTTYQYDDADQLTKRVIREPKHVTTTEYAYDLNGNQIRSGTDKFEYNLDNSLAKATVDGRVATFAYDATGLRLTTTTDPGAQAQTQRWSWDVNGTLPQIAVDTVTNSTGQTIEKRDFAYGPDDEPLALLDGAAGAHSYTHDSLGGVANMLSPSGTPLVGYDYDPFGNPRAGPTLAGQGGQEHSPSGWGGQGPGTQESAPDNPMQFAGAYQDSSSGNGNYYLRARNYNPETGRFSSADPMPQGGAATSAYTYGDNNPTSYTDPTGATPEAAATGAGDTGPSPEDVAKAQQLQSKSVLDIVLEAGGQILMEFLGINDILNCIKGDLGACVSMVIGALPWGKIFKAKKIAEAIFRAGKAVVTFFQEIKWARAILQGAEQAAQAAKAAAARAAAEAAAKAAAAKAAAETAARRAAAAAAAKAKAAAAKAKAATKKKPDCKDSFVAGTPVVLADGSRVPIEQVRPGDTVLATDPETGRTEARQVTHTIRTDDDKAYVEVTVKGEDGKGQALTTTDHHPFWSVTQGRWVEAGDLQPGELLRTSAGTYAQVGAIRHYQAEQVTYNLTVDGIHTYYVVAGDTPVLVHNVGGLPSAPGLIDVGVSGPSCPLSTRGEYYNMSTATKKGKPALTPDEVQNLHDYARGSNKWLEANGPQVVQSTRLLQADMRAAIEAERRTNPGNYPAGWVPGHMPDTGVTGMANPPSWLPSPSRANSIAGGGLSSRIGKTLRGFLVDGVYIT